MTGIAEALEAKTINWTMGFNLISCEEWCQKIRINRIFYFHHATNPSDFENYEDLLLELAAQHLNREIHVTSFLEQREKIFPRTMSISSKSKKFFLLSCQKLSSRNFFLSLQKSKSNLRNVFSTPPPPKKQKLLACKSIE